LKRTRSDRYTFGIATLTLVLALASVLYGQRESLPADQADVNDLQRAREYFSRENYAETEKICDRLVSKGGNLASEAQGLLEKVKSRQLCLQESNNILRCQQASENLADIKNRCPNYPRLDYFIAKAATCEAQAPPELKEGEALFKKGEFSNALAWFESQQTTNPNSAELQDWLHKTKVELQVQNIKASLRNNALAHARDQLTELEELAPKDDRIPKLQAELQARAAPRPTEEKQVRLQDTLLEEAVRDFYANNLPQADQLLEQYVAEPTNRNKALAYFYRGAIVCTELFLSGAKDEQAEGRAREFFSKARRADGEFSPPRDYVSPKIIEVYEKTAAGS